MDFSVAFRAEIKFISQEYSEKLEGLDYGVRCLIGVNTDVNVTVVH
jgi:hypothetical protein